MINVQPSDMLGAVIPSNQSSPMNLVASVTSRVVEFFHKKWQDIQSFPAPAQPSDLSKHAQHRIEHLLGFAVTTEQPSLAEQISQLIENSREPLTDSKLHDEVAKLLSQTSPLNSQKTYAQLTQEILDPPLNSVANLRQLPLRSRRDTQAVAPASTTRNASTQQFAKALVESEDRKLALNLANNLIHLRNAAEEGRTSDALVAIPPDSSFGQAWCELADALHSEPFKSLAETKKINMSNVSIDSSGNLYEKRGRGVTRFDLEDAEWAPASAAVLAAVKKLAGGAYVIFALTGKDQASYSNVGFFYGLPLGGINRNDMLYSIGELLHAGNFSAFTNNDPLFANIYDPVKRRQSDAIQRVVDLPQQQLSQRLAPFAAKTAEQKVQEADQLLAQRSSQALMKLAPGIGDDWEYDASNIMLTDIPEYSTFNQARKSLLTALTGSTFTAFARENNLERNSVRINPVTGDMTANVNGIETRFSANDVSGWSDVWDEIKEAVKHMATGSQSPVGFPSPQSTSLKEVMSFYNEEIPYLADYRVSNYRRLRLRAVLERSAQIDQNKGFNALNSIGAVDSRSTAVRASQNALVTHLANAPVPLSPLEALAAAVKSSVGATTESVKTSEDTLASADSTLAVTVHSAMLELQSDATSASSKMIGPIPADSLFGQWWAHLGKALKSRGLAEWALQQHVDPASLRFDPVGGVLIGKVNGVDQRFEADDFAKTYPDHFDALAPVMRAAQALVPHGKSIMLSYTGESRAPYELIANFYGIDNADYSGSQFASTTALMGRTQRFPEQPENTAQSLNQLRRQQTVLGDSNDRYALIGQLNRGILNRDESENAARFVVDPDSSHRPKGVKTARVFIAENGWNMPKWKADSDNLLRALRTPLPQPATLGNNWGFLSTDVPLNPAQREAMAGFVRDHIGALNNPLRFMGNRVTNLSADPARALEQLLSSDDALELAKHLQSQMQGAVTPTSLKQWLLTAVILHLDPRAGSQSNSVAGYDLMQPGNWGRPAKEILQGLAQHLIATNKALPDHAPVAAHVLLSGAAPQFLVKDLPDSLIFGSRQWVTFHSAVNRIEQIAPGATLSMSFKQVMDFNDIEPISRAEELQLFRAQMNPVTDWGIANGVIYKNDKRPYLEQLQDCRQALLKQTREVANARDYISNHPVPVRRTLALENLKAEFGDQVPFEARALWRESDQLNGTLASVVEAYEAGELGDTYEPQNLIDKWATKSNTPAWEAKDARIPIQLLHDSAAQLPDVNAQYDAAIESDYGPRREHAIVLVTDLLTRLPADHRNRLAYGSREYFGVRETDTSVWARLSAKTGKKGSHGIIIRATGADGKTSDIGIFPDAGVVKNIPGLPNPMPIGGTNASFGTIYDGRDEGTHALPLDFTAFNSSAAPRDGMISNVIVDRITPVTLVNGELINSGIATFGTVNQSTAPAYSNEQLENIAATCVDSHFLRKDEYKAINHGYNPLEKKGPTSLERLNFLARMIPGVTSIEDIYEGRYQDAGRDLFVDALSIVVPGALGKVWSAAANSFERVAVKLGEGVAESATGKEAATVAFKDVTATRASKAFESINRMQGLQFAETTGGDLAPTADRADGAVIRSADTERIKTTAVNRDGKWYAYDARTMGAYGPALEGFRSDTSIALIPQTLADGTDIVAPDRLFSEDALVINRATYSDVKIGHKVYRYDPKKPDALTDLESADHFGSAKGIEPFCPAGPRTKRDIDNLCFTKVISDLSGNTAKLVQGLEHMRLFPSPVEAGKPQTLIYERRLFDVIEKDGVFTTVQRSQHAPIEYLPATRGTIIKDPHFGLPGAQTFANLEQNTRIVKLEAISSASNDQRELRGTIALLRTAAGDTERYLVVEADTLTFYYSKFDSASTVLNFKKVGDSPSTLELELASQHIAQTETLLKLAGAPPRKEFVSLPSMQSAFSRLEAAGYTPAEVNELKSDISAFSDEKKREFVYQLMNKLDNSANQVVLKSASIEPLNKAGNFDSLPVAQQNKFYAEGAKQAVDSQVKATGIGSANKRFPNTFNDAYREDVAEKIVGWMRNSKGTTAANVTASLKFGAGNCGEMAEAAGEIIKKSGGHAQTWFVDGGDHVFTVVGGPSAVGKSSVDFSETEWKDAWIVDPWADISCKASEYIGALGKKMAEWAANGQEIYASGDWRSPLYPRWVNELTNLRKRPDL